MLKKAESIENEINDKYSNSNNIENLRDKITEEFALKLSSSPESKQEAGFSKDKHQISLTVFATGNTNKEKIAEQQAEVKLDNIEFLFNGMTMDAYSLGTFIYKRADDFLQKVRTGVKIVEGSKLKDMDDRTFAALVEYGNKICSNLGHRRIPSA